MSTKFIFLLTFALLVEYTISIRPYFVNSDLKVNDPLEENGKEKRSSVNNQYLDDFIDANIKKDLADYDYKDGNAEPDVDERETDQVRNIEKRESKVVTDIQSFSNADIELALSKLSEGELQVLENVIDDEVPPAKVTKRGIMDNDCAKICDSRYGCKSKNSEEFADGNYKQIITFEQLPDERQKSRKIIKRFSRFSPLSRDEILQARVNFLKDNFKRQSEIGKIENSFKRRERNQRDVGKETRNPYFNSLIGPRSRTKRSAESKLTSTHKVNPMDDPKSDEHIKLLEESFPNPNPDNSLDFDQPHIRVKRS